MDIAIPRYQVVSSLDAGRDSILFRVCDRRRPDSELVLKQVDPATNDSDAASCLKDEFAFLADLSHPNIVRAYDYGATPSSETPFFTMDFVDGVDILQACREADLEEIAFLAGQACLGLEYVHRSGRVHGDVKPSHVIVQRNGGHLPARVKWIDFGLSHTFEDTASHRFGGTPPYMAPEVTHGTTVDARADIFSLGVLLYHIFGAKYLERPVPFEPNLAGEQLDRMAQNGLPGPLASLLLKMTAKTVAERCSRATLFIETCDRLSLGKHSPIIDRLRSLESGNQFPQLVGREKLIEQFRKMVENMLHGQRGPQGLVIAGEAGIGKSRLVDTFRIIGQVAGLDCVRVSFSALKGSVYQPFFQIAELLSDDGEMSLGTIPRPDPLRPSFREPFVGNEGMHAHWDRLVTRLLDLCSGHPTVMFIEDLHLADSEGLGLWAYLARAIQGHAIFLCSTFRTGEPGSDKIGQIIRELDYHDLARNANLERLTPAEVRRLTESYLGVTGLRNPAVQSLQMKSGGNPLYLKQILSELSGRLQGLEVHSSDLEYEIGQYRFADDLRQAILRRIDRIKGKERKVLDALSVIGRPASKGKLARLTGLSTLNCADAIRRLEGAGILKVSRVSLSRYEFEHSELEAAVYDSLAKPARKKLHEGAGELALELYESGHAECLAEAASHFIASGRKPEIAQYALKAATEARKGYSYQKAVFFYEACLPCLGDDVANYALAAEDLALIYGNRKEHTKAIALYREIVDLPVEDSVKGTALRRLADLLGREGKFEETWKLFADAERLLMDCGDADRASRLGLTRAHTLMMEGRDEEALELVETMLEERTVDHAEWCRLLLLRYMAQGLMNLGRYEEAVEWLLKSEAGCEQLGDSLGLADSRKGLARAYYRLGRYQDALEKYGEAYLINTNHGHLLEAAHCQHGLAVIAYMRADFDLAKKELEESVRLFVRGENSGLHYALVTLVSSHLKTASYRAARQALNSVSGHLSALPRYIRLQYGLSELELNLHLGLLNEASQRVTQLKKEFIQFKDSPSWKVELASLEGCLALELAGRDSGGLELLREALLFASECQNPSLSSAVSLDIARYLPPEAEKALSFANRAYELAAESRNVVRQIEASFTIGRILYQRGDSTGAFKWLNPCLQQVRKSGMRDLQWQLQAMLAEIHFKTGNLRYAHTYDVDSLSLIREIRTEFDEESEWRSFLQVMGRKELYLGIANRLPLYGGAFVHHRV